MSNISNIGVSWEKQVEEVRGRERKECSNVGAVEDLIKNAAVRSFQRW